MGVCKESGLHQNCAFFQVLVIFYNESWFFIMKLDELYGVRYQESNNMNYCIDMLRLKCYISYSKFSEVEFRFATCWKKYVKKNFSSAQIKNFFYNYVIETEEGNSFWFGFLHNSEQRQNNFIKNYQFTNDTYNFTIEFNPNKIKNFFIINYLLNLSIEWYIVSYDLAIDLKVNILDLIWDMGGKRLEKIDNRGYDNKTIYIGTGDGRVKIYNKKIESNLEIIGSLTRIEISREANDFEVRKIRIWKYDDVFPTIYLNNYIYSLSDYKNKTLMAVLYAIQNGYPLRNLSRDYKAKIQKLLEGGYKIRFINKVVEDTFRNVIYYYFGKVGGIHWW